MPYLDPVKARARRQRWREKYPEREAETQRAYKEKHREQIAQRRKVARATDAFRRKSKEYRLIKQYGLTHDQYDAMVSEQSGVCAICMKPERLSDGVLRVDHDHKTGAVRALLCHACNSAIGILDENPDRMRAMAAYVERHSRRSEDGGA